MKEIQPSEIVNKYYLVVISHNMSQSSLDLYSLDNLKRIMKNVENKGKLKKGFYSG